MPVTAFSLEIKTLGDDGTFRGLASTYGNVDQGGDVVLPGAFTRTLQDSGKTRPLLWQHRDPIGLVTLSDSPRGLVCEGKLTLGVSKARESYELLRDGVVRGLSVGFQTIKEKFVDGVRQLHELRLFEVSLTPFPMNEAATVVDVKERQHAEVLRALNQLRGDIFAALEKKI